MWNVARISPPSAITCVAMLLSGFSSSLKEGMSAKSHTRKMMKRTSATGSVTKIQNHFVIFLRVFSVMAKVHSKHKFNNKIWKIGGFMVYFAV